MHSAIFNALLYICCGVVWERERERVIAAARKVEQMLVVPPCIIIIIIIVVFFMYICMYEYTSNPKNSCADQKYLSVYVIKKKENIIHVKFFLSFLFASRTFPICAY